MNGKVRLCLDLAWLNKVLIRPIHRGPTLNDILPKLAGVKYLMLINVSSGYHTLKLDKQSSYLTAFSYPFGRYRYIQLSFGVAWAGNSFRKKTDELFHGLPNVFGIADDICIVGFDKVGRNHDATLDKVLRICRQVNLKLNRDKFLFWWTDIPFSGEVISWSGGSPDSRKVQALMTMPPLKC